MSSPAAPAPDNAQSEGNQNINPPTVAAFSPPSIAQTSPGLKQRSTILVHQKSPLLVATPPQVTRALAYSHPFILPLNKFVGLLSWTSDDPWESFLLIAGFWAIVLYGDLVTKWAGPLVMVIGLMVGMYSRRYSPLSSSGITGEKEKGHSREGSESSGSRHHKSLDEILETMKTFTSRCNVMLDPLLRLTDFLSTQRTATSATTRPALTTLFVRILFITPIWILLTLPPFQLITSRRVVLTIGTLFLSWHSRPARVSRTILWRSSTVRKLCSYITGLNFGGAEPSVTTPKGKKEVPPRLPPRSNDPSLLNTKRRPGSPGVRFTFVLYENQRRWIGIGWTQSMFAGERAAWTDERLNPAPSKDDFTLPEIEDGAARWRWVEGSEWRVEGAAKTDEGGGGGNQDAGGGAGWIYYDNKWHDGKRGQDSWGRYTRRRKWYRDAELVEVTPSTEVTPNATPNPRSNPDEKTMSDAEPTGGNSDDEKSMSGSSQKRKWFRNKQRRGSETSKGSKGSFTRDRDRDSPDEDPRLLGQREDQWGMGDDGRMNLG